MEEEAVIIDWKSRVIRRKEREQWHYAFALLPTRVSHRKVVWLGWYERQYVPYYKKYSRRQIGSKDEYWAGERSWRYRSYDSEGYY